jgi:hypothetical protein
VETVNSNLAMNSPILRAIRDYWRDRSGVRKMPARRDIDPSDIPKFLPHVTLADVFHDPLRFRHRLLGTFITGFYERDATGKWLDEKLYGPNTEGMLWLYRECVRRRAPTAVRQAIPFVRKDWVTLEGVLMPLSDDGDQINILFGGIDVMPGTTSSEERIKRIVLDCDK